MRRHTFPFLLAAALLAGPASPLLRAFAGEGISVIPRPAHVERDEGEFNVTPSACLCARGIASGTLALLQGRFRDAAGFELPQVQDAGEDFRGIRILIDSLRVADREGYNLTVRTSGITITGGGDPGAYYGVQTLLGLFRPAIFGTVRPRAPGMMVPCCRIDDAPRFRWRGMHLDVSRHFFSVEFVKTYIDLLAMHRLNVFHWHLTDDQGWRIEIRKYPLLTRKGAWRVDREDRDWEGRPPQQPGEQTTYGGFYTQDEIREIVRYAAERFVTIVPEIEMPAHTLAALTAYPEYSCTGGPFTVPPGSYWPVSTIFCAGNDSTFAFLQDVLTEVLELFPGRYIHIGGDEADWSRWKQCPKCQARIRDLGLAGESALQAYFMKRIAGFLASKGRTAIGWDEILEGGLPPGAALMSWRGEAGGIEAAREGHDVVMAPGTSTYLSQCQGPAALEPPSGGGFLPLSRVYAFEPVPDSLSRGEREHILGAEGCLWSEYISTPGRGLYMLLPRLAALAEALWTPAGEKSWSDFLRRVPAQLERYDARGYTWAKSGYAVRMTSQADPASRGVRITCDTELPADTVLYTTDGSAPGPGSRVYASPIVLHESALVRACAVKGGAVYPASADSVLFHAGIFRPVAVRYPSTKYTADGTRSLTDGLFGSIDHADGRWQGYEGVDFEAVVDLGNAGPVSRAGARFLQRTGSWIFFPSGVKFELSTDGKTYETAGSFDISPARANEEPSARLWECTFPPRPARYVRVIARNVGTCPAWHPGAGGKAWLFVDEIVIQ